VTVGYELLFDANPRPMLVFDRQTLAIVAINARACELYGWSKSELLAMTIRDLRPPEDVARLEHAIGVYAGAPSAPRLSRRHMARDGRMIDVDLEMSRVELDGRPCTLCQIVDLGTSDATLRRSELNFRTLIEHLPVGTIVHRNGVIVYINPAAVRGLRYASAADVVGRSLLDLIHPDDRPAIAARAKQTVTEGRIPTAESRMLRADGTVAWVEAEAVLLEFDGLPANVVIAHEVTERRELFARVATADRLVSMGTLAAGVAHEINNPLSYLISNLEILARTVGGPLVADAREAADRVSAIVRELRELTQPAGDELVPVDVVKTLASSIKMANNELRHRARLIETYAPNLPCVDASPSRLGQVFLNMLVNAAHAIVEGSNGEVRVRATSEAGRVFIEIEDTGVGIPEDIVGRVFDPFFTTKPHGVGIGLGLAISHQIVRSLGGEIAVTSAVGKGTTFRISLRASTATRVAEAETEPPLVARSLRVLLIDDEEAVGRAVAALLAPEHEVIPVTRARAALELVATERFDAIVCDLMMPELNGMELYEQLPAHYRDRLVFMTGGAFTPQARAFLAGREYLDKPFTEEQLRRAIDRVGR